MKGSVALVMYAGPNLSTVFLVSPGAPVIPYELVWWPRLWVLYPPTKTFPRLTCGPDMIFSDHECVSLGYEIYV